MAVATVLAFVFNLDAAMASGGRQPAVDIPLRPALRHERPARRLKGRSGKRPLSPFQEGMDRVDDQNEICKSRSRRSSG